jgi:hypothetical protein
LFGGDGIEEQALWLLADQIGGDGIDEELYEN